jgi:hypothetical protein
MKRRETGGNRGAPSSPKEATAELSGCSQFGPEHLGGEAAGDLSHHALRTTQHARPNMASAPVACAL